MTGSATQGILTVLHPVSDLAKAKEVYTALLGAPPQQDSTYYVGYEAAGQHIGLVPGGGPQGMTSPVAYWHVPDIEAKLAEVTAAGATVEEDPHTADSHDLIRVLGARVNNLKDVSVEIPKRRLTVFTGVSGSGKSSLVFDTIAAESQRMINETYSAFVQGFMPSLSRPDVDMLDGLTTAIVVDQERMGANPRSTVGTATDANAMLRILFSRLGRPHVGSPNAYSFNVPSVKASGAITVQRGEGRT